MWLQQVLGAGRQLAETSTSLEQVRMLRPAELRGPEFRPQSPDVKLHFLIAEDIEENRIEYTRMYYNI